ncbi:hypothetical protein PHMEG_00032272, partial [Phytophthora megakarya]
EFDDEPTRTPARSRPSLRPPPLPGKDVSYLRANLRMVSQERRAVAKKTLAGSGKKVFRVERFADDDEDYLPYEDEDEGEDAELEVGEQERVGAANTKRKMRGKAKAKVPAKERSKTKPAANSVKAAKVAASLARCEASADAEVMGGTAKEKARKKLLEITDAKNHQKKAKATPAKRKSTSVAETQRKNRVSVNRDARTEASAVSATSPRSSTHIPVSTEQHVGAEDPSQNGEFDVLNSDCEDIETEICLVDDDEEIEWALRSNAEGESIFKTMKTK